MKFLIITALIAFATDALALKIHQDTDSKRFVKKKNLINPDSE